MVHRILNFQEEAEKSRKARRLALELLREENVWKISDIIDGLDGDMAKRALKLYVFSRPRSHTKTGGETEWKGDGEA